MKHRSVALLVVLACASIAHAWGHQGHMMVAAVAWEQMTPAQRDAAVAILENLPHKEGTIVHGGTDVPAEKRGYYMFLMAATWPDQIRDSDDPMHAEHHGNWHYVNFPINAGGVEGPAPSTATTRPGEEPSNILMALAHVRAQIIDPKTAPDRRAMALCWYLHLVGDIHQPLHAAALFSPDFPKGDEGGNKVIVDDSGRRVSLHSLWDQLPGASRSPPAAARRAGELKDRVDTKKLEADSNIAELAKWADESLELARSAAYQDGNLRGAVEEKLRVDPKTPVPALPAGYYKAAREVSDRRIMLAGMRLGKQLGPMVEHVSSATRP